MLQLLNYKPNCTTNCEKGPSAPDYLGNLGFFQFVKIPRRRCRGSLCN